MKNIPLRSFQLKPSLYLDELPVNLTRYGKVIARLSVPVITEGPVEKKEPFKTPVIINEVPLVKKEKHFNAMLNEWV